MARKLLNSYTVIDCRDLLASFRRFASRNSLTLTTVGTDWGEVFSQLYSELNRAFENKPKCLIFKHTDSLPVLLNLIDKHICVPLNRLADDNALKRSWKVIVLKEEYSRKQLKYYECLTEDNFLRVSASSMRRQSVFLAIVQRLGYLHLKIGKKYTDSSMGTRRNWMTSKVVFPLNRLVNVLSRFVNICY